MALRLAAAKAAPRTGADVTAAERTLARWGIAEPTDGQLELAMALRTVLGPGGRAFGPRLEPGSTFGESGELIRSGCSPGCRPGTVVPEFA